jgi:tetrahydromethanopterin S-methyltransferase subunit E
MGFVRVVPGEPMRRSFRGGVAEYVAHNIASDFCLSDLLLNIAIKEEVNGFAHERGRAIGRRPTETPQREGRA